MVSNLTLEIVKEVKLLGLKVWEWIAAASVSVLGYFSPIKNIIHLVLIFFVLDVIWGWLASRKLKKARFQPALVWSVTMPRIALSAVVILGMYAIDNETGQTIVNTPNAAGWIICSLLVVSILRNGFIVTKWEAIPFLSDLVKKRVNLKIEDDIDKEVITKED